MSERFDRSSAAAADVTARAAIYLDTGALTTIRLTSPFDDQPPTKGAA